MLWFSDTVFQHTVPFIPYWVLVKMVTLGSAKKCSWGMPALGQCVMAGRVLQAGMPVC